MTDMMEAMRAAILVADTHSLSAAARQLGLTHTAISKRIAGLEWQLNAKLFVRSTRHVGVTSDGEHQLRVMRHILQDFDALVAGSIPVEAGLTGRLVIRCPTSPLDDMFETALLEFLKDHPRVTVDSQFMNRPFHPLQEGFDITFAVLQNSFSGVSEETLAQVDLSLVASPFYLARRGQPETARALSTHDCLSFTPLGTQWQFAGATNNEPIKIKPVQMTNNLHVLLKMVRAGLGITVLPSILVQGSRDFIELLPEEPVQPMFLKALIPDYRKSAPLIQAFLEHVRAQVGLRFGIVQAAVAIC